MKRFFIFVLVSLFCTGALLSNALAGNVDRYLKELKSKDPKVRAEAAYELSCG